MWQSEWPDSRKEKENKRKEKKSMRSGKMSILSRKHALFSAGHFIGQFLYSVVNHVKNEWKLLQLIHLINSSSSSSSSSLSITKEAFAFDPWIHVRLLGNSGKSFWRRRNWNNKEHSRVVRGGKTLENFLLFKSILPHAFLSLIISIIVMT